VDGGSHVISLHPSEIGGFALKGLPGQTVDMPVSAAVVAQGSTTQTLAITCTKLMESGESKSHKVVTFTTEKDKQAFWELVRGPRGAGVDASNIVKEFNETRDKDSSDEYFGYYGQLSQQQNMLSDLTRTGTYQHACIRNPTEFRGKVVCDLGCGTGILCLFAAQAGARKVYGIEASDMAENARILCEANGFGDVITIIKGKAEDIELPEKVDVVISEPMGVALLNERMLESFLYCRKWLNPTGKMFPTTSFMYCSPFSDEQLYQEIANKSTFWNQEAFFGVDLKSLQHIAKQQNFKQPVVEAFDYRLLLCKPSRLELSYMTTEIEDLVEVELPIRFTMTATSTIHGFGVWFDVVFDGSDEKVVLSTSPLSATTHWYQARYLLHKPLLVQGGHTVVGKMIHRANTRQSYDISISVKVEETGQESEGYVDLKDPFYRYMAYPATLNGPESDQQFENFYDGDIVSEDGDHANRR